MKQQYPYWYKEGSVHYVRTMKKVFTIFSACFFVFWMLLTMLAFNGTELGKPILFSLSAVLLVGWFVLYAFYTNRITLGTVLGIETTNEVVHLHTARKTYTYDVHIGCVSVKKHRNRFVAVFETQDSRDSFTFFKHAPFSTFSDGQFSSDDISRFFACRPEYIGE